jgi:hypothetical protein
VPIAKPPANDWTSKYEPPKKKRAFHEKRGFDARRSKFTARVEAAMPEPAPAENPEETALSSPDEDISAPTISFGETEPKPRPGDWDPEWFLWKLEEQDEILVRRGFPAMSKWWKAELRRYFLTRKTGQAFVIRVGRRGGKSSTICRVAVCWALHGDYKIPPGDIGVAAFVSVRREESAQRLRTIEAILNALGKIPKRDYTRVADCVELCGEHEPRVCWKTFAASIAGVSGFTGIFIVGDEMAKWVDSEKGTNPAGEVVSSIMPTIATQMASPVFWVSSSFGDDDYHARLFDEGETDSQMVVDAPTWIAHPELTEERTHLLEKDPVKWEREYAARPPAKGKAGWFGDAVARSLTDEPRELPPGIRAVIALRADFANGVFAWAVVESHRENNARRTCVLETGCKRPESSPSEMINWFRSAVCARYQDLTDAPNARVYMDQEGFSHVDLARRRGVLIHVVPWIGGTNDSSRLARFKAARLAMQDGAVAIPNELALIDELGKVRGLKNYMGEKIEVSDESPRVLPLVLALSLALEGAAVQPALPVTPEDEMTTLRKKHIANIQKQRREDWSRNAGGVIRKAVSG